MIGQTGKADSSIQRCALCAATRGRIALQTPQAPQRWQGVRRADTLAAACWQQYSRNAFVWSRGEFPRSEDCLYLNIWSQAEHSAALPVMVWFHGGAHTGGFGHVDLFDGTRLAEQGAGNDQLPPRPWGFLAHPALSKESSHNSLVTTACWTKSLH